MKNILVILLLLVTYKSTNAQGAYDVARIQPDLLKNASVIIRMEDQNYEVKNPGSATLQYKTVITILNKNGEDASAIHEFYDKFSSIYNLKAILYDAKGIKIKEYRNADFKDRSAVSDGTIYDDSRIKYLEILNNTFPYTIEYSYSIDYSGIRSYPSWYPSSSWGYAIEKSEYTFKIPETMTFKYLKSKDLKTDSLKIKDKNQYKWSCQNIKAIEYEPLSVGLRNVLPWVMVAPNTFEFDESKGNIENWKNVGSWLYSLSSSSQLLPDAARAKVRSIIKNAATPKEKIKLLYNYLQSNTRYVGVQLGIGGYKPIAAEKVFSVNYGDCKALSNFMKAMLQEAGIKSDLVMIGNDMPSLNTKYASLNQANHMILCVPMEKDTTWLECTSQYVPAGFIGNGNSDKTVLLITDKGGKLAQTPTYSPANNFQKRVATVHLDAEGSAAITIETKYGNAQYEDNMGMLYMEPTEQRKRLINSLSIPNIQMESFSFTQPDKELPVLMEKISLKCTQLLTKGGDKLFLTLNMLNRQEGTITTIDNRKTFFAVDYSYQDDDEIIYTIPKGYKLEYVPADIILESEFGRYTAKAVVKDDKITYTRTKMMTNKKYPPEKYNEYVAFSKKIYQSDKQKTVLAKVE
ncbi:transglutaminase superfamily protein [Pedobacter metabolipauper]|uniref:Transglutaminase superfamily protein n=2 Tax=Pedobacter metabolipauper TaxID=425513 RepID=A0A4V3D0L7_9SPHI|nr:transglutaminase superfamily protein [Pedobacter metabolipauper]